APEALLNLAMYAEVSERSDPNVAKRWYVQLARDFSDQPAGRRAQGAQMRLASTGKQLSIQGKTLDGRDFNLRAVAGKVVVVHFWATWCDACIEEFSEFQRLAAKYNRELVVIGVNLDDSADDVRRFLQQNRQVNWPQLYEPGGLEESPLAEQWGIPTLPWIVLLDQSGNAVNTNAAALELDREIQKLLDEK
ncbi:MAG TPA: TlpA disulfide reductase family protein, partial [Pirellulaceae bacterium]|nr:TlpA disulfide reductase family protein [Pirellulaceae bacterium]